MRDMIPKNGRSIRNIPVPASHRRAASPKVVDLDLDEESMEDREAPPPARPPRRRRGGGGRRKWFFIIALIVIGIGTLLAILLSTLFAGATVTVFPREETVAAPASLTARINAPVGSLSYQTMTINRSATTTVPATGTKQVTRQASGLLTIYNEYNTSPQRLIANTRFAAPDGKIYRIHESVVVPGMSGTTPGSITITVFADSPGAEYNRGTTRFTIPGFEDDPRYEDFYATAQSITGGFVGQEPSVAQADLTAAQNALEQNLVAGIQAALLSEVPDGYLPLTATLDVTYSNLMQTPGSGGNAILSQTAQGTVAIVRSQDLAAAIAAETVQNYAGEAVAFVDPSQLSIDVTVDELGGPLTLQLSGTPTLVWQYDPAALVSTLQGKDKGSFQEVVQSFEPAIMRAEAKIRPFWQGNFPEDKEKIEVVRGEES